MSNAIGIDLGTSRTMAAVMDDGLPHMLTDAETGVPSVVAVDAEGHTLVGEAALVQEARDPRSAIRASKRLLGQSIQGPSRDLFTYEISTGPDASLLVHLKDKVLTLEQVSASILSHITKLAAQEMGRMPEGVVVTVPAYFNERQRQAVHHAAELANLNVIGLLNEPTAAALAHGLGRELNQRVLVFDLGGGTFDLSVIDINGSVYEVIATGGDTALGGVDFDDRILEHLLDHLESLHGSDITHDLDAIRTLRELSERAKIALSKVQETRIHQQDLGEGKITLDFLLSRETLEELADDLVQRTLEVTTHVLEQAAVRLDSFDELLLVGGQSRMPRIRKAVCSLLGMPVSSRADPDGAVATGAAVLAWSLSHENAGSPNVTEILPLAVGVGLPGGRMQPLFERGIRLPTETRVTLTTHTDNQASIRLTLYQGHNEFVRNNAFIGHFSFGGLPAMAKGGVLLDLTLHLDSSGLLSITAIERSGGETVACEVRLRESATVEAQPEPPLESPPALPALEHQNAPEQSAGVSPKAPGPPASNVDPSEAPDPPGIVPMSTEIKAESVAAPPGLEDLEPPPPPPSTEGESQVLPGAAVPYSPLQSLLDRLTGWFRSIFGG